MSQLISQSHDMPPLSHQSLFTPRSRATRSVTKRQRLIASLEDSPLMSAYTAGIFKPKVTSPSVPEIMPVSTALPIMGIDLWCVWDVHAAESSNRSMGATDYPEMVMPAADTLETMALATEIPETATPATDASEMAALTTECSERPAQAVEIHCSGSVLAAECSEKAANAADSLGWLTHAATPFAVVSSIHELFVFPASTRHSDDELSARCVAINDSKD